jgi:DNA-binding CsgD family transcriptional regulator
MAQRVRQADVNSALTLSPRELEVLEMTALGLTNFEVGNRLDLSVHGVKFHLASIYRKLGVSNRTEAATMFLRSMSDSRREAGS